MEPNELAKAFVDRYYSTFDTNRQGLDNLYKDGSMLSFGGEQFQGAQNIVAKLPSLPFQHCRHYIRTLDCQPSGPADGFFVFVTGNLQVAGEQRFPKFCQRSPFGCNLSLPFHLSEMSMSKLDTTPPSKKMKPDTT